MQSTRRGSFSVHRSEKTPGSKYSSTSAADLASVRVAAECEVDIGAGRAPEYDRVVCEEELELIGESPFQRRRQVCLAHHVVVDAAEPEWGGGRLEPETFVDEHADAVTFEMPGHCLGVRPVIMVAEASIETVCGSQ